MSCEYSEDEMIALYQQGNYDYLETMVQRYIPYMRAQMKRYRVIGFDADDMLQECRIVMHRAIETFDYGQNVCFFTYFSRLLRNHFCRLLRHYTTQKRNGDNHCVSYEEFDMDSYMGGGYAHILNPLDVLIVRESFDAGYDTLTKGEQAAIHQKYYLEKDDIPNAHALYRGETKLKKSIRCR